MRESLDAVGTHLAYRSLYDHRIGDGALVIGRGGFAGMAIAALCQGVLAAGLALPFLRRPR